MRKIAAEAFARLLNSRLADDHRFAFFLGAGCSRSSGIRMAGDLVRHWIEEHHRFEGASGTAASWAKSIWPTYDDANPAAHYGDAMDHFYPTAALRQVEIDRQVQGKNPGLGYATIAALLAHEKHGPKCNIVLTTNFDDLVADALYLFTRKRPLVVTHGALAGFARQTSNKPLVVKLHGDVHLSPQNTTSETSKLNDDLEQLFSNLIHERGLIFIGYGANDKSVLSALQKLSEDHVQAGIFWVNDTLPQGEFGQWLKDRKAVWVDHLDFDRMMFLIHGELKLPELDRDRFAEILKGYDQKLDEFIKGVGVSASQPAPSPTDEALIKAAQSLMSNKQDAHTLLRQAYLLPTPDDRIAALRAAVKQHQANPVLLGALATELLKSRQEPDEAEAMYRRAIEVDPNRAITLGNFANFLTDIRQRHDEAEQMYRRAIKADPVGANNLGNYARLLFIAGRSDEATERLDQAMALAKPGTPDALSLELWFYRLAHDHRIAPTDALRQVRDRLLAGDRSPGWDLSGNVARAREDGHPFPDLLAAIATVIADAAPLSSLDAFPEWQEAGYGVADRA